MDLRLILLEYKCKYIIILNITFICSQFLEICSGDVVLNINGKEVKSVKDVLNEIGLEVGKSLDITVRRREDVLKLTFTTAPEVSRSS